MEERRNQSEVVRSPDQVVTRKLAQIASLESTDGGCEWEHSHVEDTGPACQTGVVDVVRVESKCVPGKEHVPCLGGMESELGLAYQSSNPELVPYVLVDHA